MWDIMTIWPLAVRVEMERMWHIKHIYESKSQELVFDKMWEKWLSGRSLKFDSLGRVKPLADRDVEEADLEKDRKSFWRIPEKILAMT